MSRVQNVSPNPSGSLFAGKTHVFRAIIFSEFAGPKLRGWWSCDPFRSRARSTFVALLRCSCVWPSPLCGRMACFDKVDSKTQWFLSTFFGPEMCLSNLLSTLFGPEMCLSNLHQIIRCFGNVRGYLRVNMRPSLVSRVQNVSSKRSGGHFDGKTHVFR